MSTTQGPEANLIREPHEVGLEEQLEAHPEHRRTAPAAPFWAAMGAATSSKGP